MRLVVNFIEPAEVQLCGHTFLDVILLNRYLQYTSDIARGVPHPYIISTMRVARGLADLSHTYSSPSRSGHPASNPARDVQSYLNSLVTTCYTSHPALRHSPLSLLVPHVSLPSTTILLKSSHEVFE